MIIQANSVVLFPAQWESSGFVSVEVGQQEMVVEFLGFGTPLDDIIPMYISRIPRVQIALGRRHTARRVLPELADYEP